MSASFRWASLLGSRRARAPEALRARRPQGRLTPTGSGQRGCCCSSSRWSPPRRRPSWPSKGGSPSLQKVVDLFIKGCEAFNGGTIDENEKATTTNLNTAITYIGGFFPDSAKVKADLQRFAKLNDRRNYQLIKFAIGSESDFKTVHGAIKELIKRIQGGNAPHLLDTLLPILYRSSCLMFSRSHLPAIMDCSKSDKDGLGAVAHEVLGEISQRNPDIFKTHVGDLCKSLAEQAPSRESRTTRRSWTC